ncbi:YciK family oxidoreductase [Catenovulum sp. 2E275]|uniref:YciK family oxidoreductase n=1 Tax=Catenovulum sp. 2E275 TaxID=2980497 RepID=UPI0021D313FF|nr:YciK family oxidoreductase [Catenovulum sp. 2E275]MCU4674626.1 YciK family oxidoreductase [Catenovulum sp. 2E275]
MLDYAPQANCLDNKVILVTGAGDGIGKAAAISYATHGAEVILLGKTTEKLEKVYDEIVALGAKEPAIVPLDMQGATKQHYLGMAQTIEDMFGRLDGLLHNASQLGTIMPFEQWPQEKFEKVMQVNVNAQFMMTQALLPLLKKSACGSVIFTSSSVGRKGRAFWGGYAISKFATEGMMQVLADEFDNTAMRFNCINPGATATKMRAVAYPAEDPSSIAQPADIMPVYLYLMDDVSQSVSGQSLNAQQN